MNHLFQARPPGRARFVPARPLSAPSPPAYSQNPHTETIVIPCMEEDKNRTRSLSLKRVAANPCDVMGEKFSAALVNKTGPRAPATLDFDCPTLGLRPTVERLDSSMKAIFQPPLPVPLLNPTRRLEGSGPMPLTSNLKKRRTIATFTLVWLVFLATYTNAWPRRLGETDRCGTFINKKLHACSFVVLDLCKPQSRTPEPHVIISTMLDPKAQPVRAGIEIEGWSIFYNYCLEAMKGGNVGRREIILNLAPETPSVVLNVKSSPNEYGRVLYISLEGGRWGEKATISVGPSRVEWLSLFTIINTVNEVMSRG